MTQAPPHPQPIAHAGATHAAPDAGDRQERPPVAEQQLPDVAPGDLHPDVATVLVDAEQIRARLAELAAAVAERHRVRGTEAGDLVLVAVLKGAVMVMADLARVIPVPVQMDFMCVSSYGAATTSSGVVRILKDLDSDITGKHVLVVEDVVDSGLTLSWLVRTLRARRPASLEVLALLRKPEAARAAVDVAHVGFDLPDEFVVGYGLDYAERYRDLPYVGVLRPEVYASR